MEDLVAEPLTRLSYRFVLVPLDGSPYAAAALPTARALAHRLGAELRTISVASDDRDLDRMRRDAEAAVGGGAGQDAVEVLVGDDAAHGITVYADELGSCVVCMSTKGRGRVAGTVIGSVARSVLTRSRAPIVAVGPQADRPTALVGRPRRRPASWPVPLSLGRLLACVDGSPGSETVLPEAARWSTTLDLPLSVVTVADDSPVGAGGTRSNRFGPRDPEGYVKGLADRWRGVAVDVEPAVVVTPLGVASGVRDHIATHPTALVAVTTHARTGRERLRLGATAADIIRASTAPALVVPLVDDGNG
jgi:nucleotide-binding universal stress UspA family protein